MQLHSINMKAANIALQDLGPTEAYAVTRKQFWK